MKKSKKTAFTAALFAAALNMTACTPPDANVQTEYGAPIAVPTEPETFVPDTEVPDTEVLETTNAPEPEETYQLEEEIPQDVYGPPEYFDDTIEEENSQNPEEVGEEPELENQPEEITEYDPQIEMPRLVYGPPEAFGE